MRFVIIFLITVWTLPAGAGTVECDRLLAENRATVDHRDALDAQYFRIDDHPELRVNRFLASFRQDTLDPAAKREWLFKRVFDLPPGQSTADLN